MTFSRIKAVGWQVNEKVTSGQLNQLDLDHFNSLDKTGDNSTNGGGISGRVDILSGASLEINSGATLKLKSGGSIDQSGGVYSLTGGTMVFNNSTGITFNDSSGMTMNGNGNFIIGSSASELCAGVLNITSGGTLGINSGGTLHVKSGATQYVDTGGTLQISGAGNVNVVSGGNINLQAGSYLNATSATSTIDGGLVIIQNGALVTTSGTGSFITVGSGNTFNVYGTHKTDVWGTWNTPQSRLIVESTTSGIAVAGTWAGGLQFVYDTGTGGAWSQQLQRVHHGATLQQLSVGLSVGNSHSSVPANRPSLSLVRYRWDGMFSAQALSTVDPQVFPNPGSGSAYYNSGNQQFMNYICNQNNVIDNENYIYVLTITDESGAGSANNNAYGLIYMQFTNIPNQKWNT